MIFRTIVALLVLVSVPFLLQAGYGFYHGLDVRSGLTSLVTGFLGDSRVFRSGFSPASEPIEALDLPVTWQGDLVSESLEEASGLADSRLNRKVLFSINDSGNAPRLFALGYRGEDLGSWSVNYPDRHDFEDIAAFASEGKRYLVIADTGDNFYWRPTLTLIVIEEPDLETVPQDTVLEPAWTLQFRFPEGYRDIEGVAVDEEARQFLLVSKRRVPAELFAVPLRADDVVTAEHVGDLMLPQPSQRDLREDPDWGKSRSMTTAFDIRDRFAVIQTYKDAYLYKRNWREPWLEAFRRPPQRVRLPQVYGLESVALTDSAIVVTGERKDGMDRTGVFHAEL